jgi:hypothetical protein
VATFSSARSEVGAELQAVGAAAKANSKKEASDAERVMMIVSPWGLSVLRPSTRGLSWPC